MRGIVSVYKPKLMALMSDGEARNCTEMALAVGCGDKLIRTFVTKMVIFGEAHVDSYRGPHAVAFYRAGVGQNAVKPAPKTAPEVLEKLRVKSRKRAPAGSVVVGDWWPRADPVVVSAISQMVRAGRVSA